MNITRLTYMPLSLITLLVMVSGCAERNLGPRHQTRLEKAYRNVSFEYESEIDLLKNEKDKTKITASLHETILVKNDIYNKRYPYNDWAEFPYLQYNHRLDNDIYRLENAILKSSLAEDDLQDKARKLLKQLRYLKRLVVTNSQFQQEKKQKAKVDAQYAVARATDRVALATVLSGPRKVEHVETKKTDVTVNIHDHR